MLPPSAAQKTRFQTIRFYDHNKYLHLHTLRALAHVPEYASIFFVTLPDYLWKCVSSLPLSCVWSLDSSPYSQIKLQTENKKLIK